MTLLRICGLLGLLVAWSAARADPTPTPAALRELVLKAADSEAKADAYKELFLRVGRAGLKDLAEDPDPGIALQAAWELHKKTSKRPQHVRGRSDDIYDPDELTKFVGILEKRLRTKAPAWWSDSFRDFDLNPGSDCFVALAYKKHGLPTKTVGVVAGGLFVRADCPESATDYELEAYELRSGRRAWKAGVWPTSRSVISGIQYHRVELKEKDGCLYVFGLDGDLYLEVFDAATGRCWVRFCTSYWCHYSEAWGLK